MADTRRFPTGRTGRLWLLRRLGTARRGVDLLDRKLRILRGERERFRLLADTTEQAWASAAAEAREWEQRAAVAGGRRALRHASGLVVAEATVEWRTVMGVRYPSSVRCTVSAVPASAAGHACAALAEAALAYRRAVDAAVQHAAAAAALRAVDAELTAVSRQIRAIEGRWVPRLEAALGGVEQRLEESERSENVRLRWAAARGERT